MLHNIIVIVVVDVIVVVRSSISSSSLLCFIYMVLFGFFAFDIHAFFLIQSAAKWGCVVIVILET